MSPAAAAPVTAVIAAAGSGERLGAGGPKAFVALAGRPIVEWSIAAMRTASSIGPIVVACPPGHAYEPPPAPTGEGGGELRVIDGGGTRSESVSNALAAVETDLVAIHDAARPLVTPDLIDEVIAALLADPDATGAIAATPITDTVKQAAGGPASPTPEPDDPASRPGPRTTRPAITRLYAGNAGLVIEKTLDRGRLWAAQTPQVFRVEALRAALEADPHATAAATDEAMLVEAGGGRVLICPSPPKNLKVTTPLDLKLAEFLLG
jgi:2-C-methyl-D-erythritol 4-phosphate cytidylyltransferase